MKKNRKKTQFYRVKLKWLQTIWYVIKYKKRDNKHRNETNPLAGLIISNMNREFLRDKFYACADLWWINWHIQKHTLRVYTVHAYKNNECKSFLYLETIDKITVIFFTEPFFHSIIIKKRKFEREANGMEKENPKQQQQQKRNIQKKI